MPYGKIVVIKRGGGDGTEFPLTATCLFGRKPDCDIRIQLPHVSKEHCRVELNENKEVVLTNMSSVNPTRVNGAELQQAERLKHGDIITIIDRSFRFEYPPKQTPKKSLSGKADALQLRTPGENKTDTFTGPRLKDGASNDNIQRSLEKTVEVDSKGENESMQHGKVDSPFSELYQMIKNSLETPVKPTGHQPQTPATKNAKTGRISKVVVPDVLGTPAKVEVKSQAVTPAKSPKRARKSREVTATPQVEDGSFVAQQTPKTGVPPQETPKEQRLSLPALTPAAAMVSATPEMESTQEASAAVEQPVEKPKTPTRRKSKEVTPATPAAGEEQPEPTPAACCATPGTAPAVPSPRVSPRSVEKKVKALSLLKELEAKAAAKEKMAQKKRELEAAASPMVMRKRVSFGGHLSPELFDKRLPPSSPLQKGATPRRSLGHARPKQSLLRRASAIGLIKESDEVTSKKAKSPKAKTPSPARKSPKAASDTPSGEPSPSVSGRFSVSRINTPSPIPGEDTAPPKVPVRRKSISRKTPRSALRNAAEVQRRRSGVSRASLKIKKSWVDVVKFGQTKTQVVAPARRLVATQKVKAVVAQPKTPARKSIKEHVTTGHADSPVTIVVGKAFNQRAVQHVGAAPKLVHNVALLKKQNMKLDEDLTGIADIFSTPVNSRTRKSDLLAKTATATPCSVLSASAVEMSVMNTPEEIGEMVVSPIVVGSVTKPRAFNSEAVQRLLLSEEGSSFNGDAPALEDPIQEVDAVAAPPTPKQKPEDLGGKTPKQKPQKADGLSAVKRIVKTPKQKSEPIEDLRGKLLKTPKQKPVQPDGLSAVKRIMKTPRQKSEPMEDLRGKLLKTPRAQKVSAEMDLNGVQQLLETPKQRQQPVSVAPEVVVEETQPAIAPIEKVVEDTIAPTEEVMVVEETIAPIEEVMVVEETIAPIEEVVGETIAPIETVVEDTIAPTEEVVEETIAPTEEVVVVEETIAPTEEVVVVEETIAPIEKVVEETIAPIEEVVEETIAPIEKVEETIAPTEEVVVVEETIAPIEKVVVETIAPIEKKVAEENPLASSEDTITPTEEALVDESLASPEESIAPTEEVVVEETIAPVEEVMVDELTENIENQHGETAVAAPDMATEPVPTDAPAEEPERMITMETAPETAPAEEEETVVAPTAQDAAQAPSIKSVRGKRAGKRAANEEAPAPEEPAPTTIKARRGRPAAQKTPAPEETSLKPKRGRNAKQAPAVEAVSETSTTTEEETSDPAPSTDAVTAAVPPPVKTGKGRNSKQVQEQPTTTPQLEEEEPAAPAVIVEKPRRGRKAAKQEPQQEKVPVAKVPEESIEEEEEVAEEAPPAAVVKPRRGRKAAPEPAVAKQVSTEDQAPSQARRGRPTKAKPEEGVEVEVPVAPEAVVKPAPAKRTRKTKQESVEETASEERNVVVEDKDKEEVEEVIAPVAPSKTRGRRGKRVEEEEVVEEEVIAPVAPSKTRGRRGKRVEEEEVVVEEQPPAESAVAAAPAEKPRRGRRQTTAEEPEAAAPPSAATVPNAEKPKRGGRRAKAEQQVVPEEDVTELPQEEKAESTSAPVAEQPEKPVKSTRGKRAAVTEALPPAAPPKRGRRGAVAEPSAAVTPAAARRRAGKLSAVEAVEVPAVEPATEDQEAEGEQEEKVLPTKGRVSKKTKPAPAVPTATEEDGKTSTAVNRKDSPVTCETPTPVAPVKSTTRGRKAAVAPASEPPAPAVAVKRKVSRTQSKAEEAPLSHVSLPVKRTRRATKLS